MSILSVHVCILGNCCSIESTKISIKHEVAQGDETDARKQLSLEKIVARILRVETRLDLL